MKSCPACGAAYPDEDKFCESDGTPLPGTAPPSTSGSTVKCSGCGALGSDDGDGYCSACGHRLSSDRSHLNGKNGKGAEPVQTGLPDRGRELCGYHVLGHFGVDAVLARAPDGGERVLAFGREPELLLERGMLAELAGRPPFARLAPQPGPFEEKPRSFLALLPPPAGGRRLAEVGHTLTAPEAVRKLDQVLDICQTVESKGGLWAPVLDDFFLLPDLALALVRVRMTRRLEPGERLDVGHIIETVGAAFVPEPAVRGPSRLVRLLAHPPRHAEPPKLRPLPRLRGELDVIDLELAQSLPPSIDPRCAELSDAGLRHLYNQDVTAIASGEIDGQRWSVMVVCDGVSSSPRSEEAAALAAKVTRDLLCDYVRKGDPDRTPGQAVGDAIHSAHRAVCEDYLPRAGEEPPGTTLVAALVHQDHLTVGWVGDSRAYWLTPRGGELLTRDHSWINEALDRGELTEEEAQSSPLAHAITRCLGPLEGPTGEDGSRELKGVVSDVRPEIRSRDLPGPGVILLCSDGLWNYTATVEELGRLVRSTGLDAPATGIARLLINYALARGGQDNVSVALYDYTPSPRDAAGTPSPTPTPSSKT